MNYTLPTPPTLFKCTTGCLKKKETFRNSPYIEKRGSTSGGVGGALNTTHDVTSAVLDHMASSTWGIYVNPFYSVWSI
jgi:hypothetical protein